MNQRGGFSTSAAVRQLPPMASKSSEDRNGKAASVVFIAPTGVGKTGLASALLLKALLNGHRGLFVRAQELFDEMYASLADRSSRKLI